MQLILAQSHVPIDLMDDLAPAMLLFAVAQEPKGKQKKPAGPAPVTTAELMKHLEAELIAHPDKCEVRLHENMQSATKKVLDQTSKELGLHW